MARTIETLNPKSTGAVRAIAATLPDQVAGWGSVL